MSSSSRETCKCPVDSHPSLRFAALWHYYYRITSAGFFVASVLGAICTAMSGVGGIIVIIRTNAYTETIDYKSCAKQMQGMSLQGYFEGSMVPARKCEKSQFRLTVPLIRYSY